MKNNKIKFIKKSDWLIIGVLCLLPIFFKFFMANVSLNNSYYMIKSYIDNRQLTQFVESDRVGVVIVKGKLGNLILDFDKEKGVRIASSSCPCQICVNSGWSKYDSLVCVPNAIIVQPVRQNQDSSKNNVDAITR